MTENTHQIGQNGEDLAAAFLRQNGYTIICRNFRRRCGEIDIIAHKGGCTYFVEVKSRRQALLRPAVNVTPGKRRQIARVAALWFSEQGAETVSKFLIAEVYLNNSQVVLTEDFLC